MTTFEIIATILIAAALFLLVRGAVKLIDLEQQLTDSENEADTYAREVGEVKTQLEAAKKDVEKLQSRVFDEIVALNSTDEDYTIGQGESCYLVKRIFAMPRGQDLEVTIKRFGYDNDDYADGAMALRDAHDLLAALKDKIGWRVAKKESIG